MDYGLSDRQVTFYGRERELAFLDSVYNGPGLRTCLVVGRRRIGKSALLDRFSRGKRSVSVQFQETSRETNLWMLSLAMSCHTGGSPKEYGSLTEALEDLARICAEERTLIVFDEFPFLLGSIPDASANLQHFIDRVLSWTDSMMVICGSSISMMMRETSDPSRPLFGRFIRRLDVGPMTLSDCRSFHVWMSDADLLKLYLVLGGVPAYHSICSGGTFDECMDQLFFGDSPLLDEEWDLIIRREFNPASNYSTIISAIARGSVNLRGIAARCGIPESTCKHHIDGLSEVGLVGTVNPMAGAPKAPRYRITDPLLLFSHIVLPRYRVMRRNSGFGSISGMTDQDVSTFLGLSFEDYCTGMVAEHYPCEDIGKWWGRIDGETTDIDIVARIRHQNMKVDLFVECMFRRKPAGMGVLNDLIGKVEGLRGTFNERLMIISVSGFEDNLIDFAEENGILLVGFDEIMGNTSFPEL